MKLKKKLQFGMKLELSDQTLQRPFFFLRRTPYVLLKLHTIFFLPVSAVHVCLEYAIKAH